MGGRDDAGDDLRGDEEGIPGPCAAPTKNPRAPGTEIADCPVVTPGKGGEASQELFLERGGGVVAALGLRDVRGHLAEYDVTRLVLEFADAHACDRLFDVGLSATLLRLEPAEVQVEETGGPTDVEVEDFVAARPDGVSRAETELVAEHCEALAQLASRVQRRVGRHDHVRLLGLDRFGVRFRCRAAAGATTSACPSPRR